jgi:hypothetical protein
MKSESPTKPIQRSPWLRFNVRHLLALMTCVAIGVVVLNSALDVVCAERTTIEITMYHSESRSVGYTYGFHNGSSTSAVPIPDDKLQIDYTKMVGRKFTMRYRAHQLLWLRPENHSIVAFRLIWSEVKKFADSQSND